MNSNSPYRSARLATALIGCAFTLCAAAAAPVRAGAATAGCDAKAAAASSSASGTASQRRSMTVSIVDLDLSTAAGQQVAQQRLHEAARRLCTRLSDSEDLGHQPHFLACVERASVTAMRQLGQSEIVARQAAMPSPPPALPAAGRSLQQPK